MDTRSHIRSQETKTLTHHANIRMCRYACNTSLFVCKCVGMHVYMIVNFYVGYVCMYVGAYVPHQGSAWLLSPSIATII